MTLRKALHTGTMMGDLVVITVLLGLLLATYFGSVLAQVGLGVSLAGIGVWTLVKSKSIWASYKKSWKRRPKSQKSIWNEPKDVYYYFNMVFIIPMLIGLGVGLILLAYFRLM